MIQQSRSNQETNGRSPQYFVIIIAQFNFQTGSIEIDNNSQYSTCASTYYECAKKDFHSQFSVYRFPPRMQRQ